MREIGTFLETGIPKHALISAIAALGGSILAFSLSLKSLVLMVSFALLTLGFNSLNAVSDIKEDSISRKYRAIPSGRISPRKVLALSTLSFFLSFALVIRDYPILFVVLLDALLLVLYSFGIRLKRYLFLSNSVVSLHYTAFPLLSGWLLYRPATDFPVSVASVIFLFGALFSIFEDFCDVAGDRKSGIRTFPVVFGAVKARIYAGYLSYLPYTLLLTGILLGFFSAYFLVLLLTLPFARAAISLLSKDPEKALDKVLFVSVLWGVLAVLAYVFTAYL